MRDIDGYVTKDNLYRLISKIRRNFDIVVDDKTCCIITDAISKMKPEDVRPVKYGYWSECYTDNHHYSGICSVCGHEAIRKVKAKPLALCPNCGARMDGETKDEDISRDKKDSIEAQKSWEQWHDNMKAIQGGE